jgi:hypothetical protein
MNWYEWGLIALLFLIIAFVVIVGYIGAARLFFPKHGDFTYTRRRENERSPGLMDIYDSWQIEKYHIDSRHDYKIAVYYVEANVKSKNFVVIAHGYGYTHHGIIKYAKLMLKLGFNVVMFDERYHGASGGKFCGMGFYEKDDLYDLVTDTYSRYGKDIIVGTYGESMGGATVILELAIDKRIKFAVTDCTFADLRQLMLYQVKKTIGLPAQPFVFFTNLFFKWKTKVALKEISPIKELEKSTCPMLFIHGEEDSVIPPSHSRMLYEACPTPKALYIAGNHARHTDSVRYNESEYFERLKSFLTDIVKIYDRSNSENA